MRIAKRTAKKPVAPSPLKLSKLQVFDIPLDRLVGDDMNPNEMKEDKFDLLVQEIQDNGFDEPIIVIPHPALEGSYLIAGGHHRTKAARVIGMESVPAVIKENWNEDQQKIALVKRNILHGTMNTQKFTVLWEELSKTYDPEILKTLMAFTEKKEFEAVYEGMGKGLTPKQRKVLANSKEKIKSVDDLTSVLHKIFKEQGSESDSSYVVFSFGGKRHHYIQVDDVTSDTLTAVKERMDTGESSLQDFLQRVIADTAESLGINGKKVERKSVRKLPIRKSIK